MLKVRNIKLFSHGSVRTISGDLESLDLSCWPATHQFCHDGQIRGLPLSHWSNCRRHYPCALIGRLTAKPTIPFNNATTKNIFVAEKVFVFVVALVLLLLVFC